MSSIAVLLIENSPLFRSALCNILVELGFSVTATEHPLVKEFKERGVILVDVATLPENAGDLEGLLGQFSKMGPVLLMAREDRVEPIVKGLRAGALGFIKQTASRRDLANAVRALANGGTWCDVGLFRKVMRYLPPLPYLRRARFTKREEEVLACVSRGEHNKEIAHRLCVTEQSVKVYVSNLLRKTGALNRNELAFVAVDLGTQQK
jgi:two-component system nitrate/nitrite response regulator NarL